ncbi:MAG TPA: class I SAM-dependent methyltransferase [Solirubrobacteraceae bacterium]|nr:class I SAM-dependent methyltransferase [Solirubrobacteraceae bacterium]
MSRDILRKAVSALVPQAGKNAIDGARARRLVQQIFPLNERYIELHGLDVRRGPFAGMHYTRIEDPAPGNLVAKLVGTYEQQVYPWLTDRWIGGDFDVVLDVGCAEGFYAVGLARAMPRATVHAFDTYEPARRECARLAAHNGVGERVIVREFCTPETLAEFANAKVALLSDCEGYEKVLLDPAISPSLSRWSLIVEQHDNEDPTISATLQERFGGTHEIETIDFVSAEKAASLPELSWMTKRELRLVLDERPAGISWALFSPLSS